MAEFDTTHIKNVLKEDFEVRFNGEMYSVPAGETKTFPEFLAFHIAKHLSDKVLSTEIAKVKEKNKDNPFNPQVAQLLVYDNAKRRIALFDILGSKELVERCINAYPFKDFIGTMEEYDKYVAKNQPTKSVKDGEKMPEPPVEDDIFN